MTWQKSLEELLARAIGLDPASLGQTLVLRALQRRMRAVGIAREGEYLARLQSSNAELQELIEELVVSETWFFRDNEPFVLLRQHATAWLAAPTGTVFRALSLACATGDEPYSIAMVLRDVGMPRDRFEIDAVDISHRALEKARRGVYGLRVLRHVESNFASFRARFFRDHPEGAEVDPEIRSSVRFLHGNLVQPESLPLRPASYDVIFCRNLLIYLTESARERAVATLDRLLGPRGLLFVGHAERLPLLESRFTPVKFRLSFAYQRRSAEAPPSPRAPSLNSAPFVPSPPPAARPLPSTARPTQNPLLAPSARSTPSPVLGDHRPPRAPLPPLGSSNGDRPPGPAPAPAPGPRPSLTGDLDLDQAHELANRHQYDMAMQICEQLIRVKGPTAPALFLLGTICNAMGDTERAEKFLGRAVYLDPDHEEALQFLANIAMRRGDTVLFKSYQRRAERARSRKP